MTEEGQVEDTIDRMCNKKQGQKGHRRHRKENFMERKDARKYVKRQQSTEHEETERKINMSIDGSNWEIIVYSDSGNDNDDDDDDDDAHNHVNNNKNKNESNNVIRNDNYLIMNTLCTVCESTE